MAWARFSVCSKCGNKSNFKNEIGCSREPNDIPIFGVSINCLCPKSYFFYAGYANSKCPMTDLRTALSLSSNIKRREYPPSAAYLRFIRKSVVLQCMSDLVCGAKSSLNHLFIYSMRSRYHKQVRNSQTWETRPLLARVDTGVLKKKTRQTVTVATWQS